MRRRSDLRASGVIATRAAAKSNSSIIFPPEAKEQYWNIKQHSAEGDLPKGTMLAHDT